MGLKIFSTSASLVAQTVKRLPAMWEARVRSLGREDPWRRKWQPTPVLLPGKFHGRRSLVGYSPRGRKESDTTERLHFTVAVMLSELLCGKPVKQGRKHLLLPEPLLWDHH